MNTIHLTVQWILMFIAFYSSYVLTVLSLIWRHFTFYVRKQLLTLIFFLHICGHYFNFHSSFSIVCQYMTMPLPLIQPDNWGIAIVNIIVLPLRLTRPGFSTISRPVTAPTQIESEGAAHAINMVISQVSYTVYSNLKDIYCISHLDAYKNIETWWLLLLPYIREFAIVSLLSLKYLHEFLASSYKTPLSKHRGTPDPK